MIWFGTAISVKKIENINLTLRVGSDIIKPISVVRALGVLLVTKRSSNTYVCHSVNRALEYSVNAPLLLQLKYHNCTTYISLYGICLCCLDHVG